MIDQNRIENAIRELLLGLGEDPDREGLLETPRRVAEMYAEIYAGLEKDPLEDAKVFYEEGLEDLVIIRDIPVYSTCEHHLMPFFGTASVAYLPKNGRILGLSKVARMVDTLAKRPQLQERLTAQIANTIEAACDPQGVLVTMQAEHLCVSMRGIRKPGTKTASLSARGVLKTDPTLQQTALTLLQAQNLQ